MNDTKQDGLVLLPLTLEELAFVKQTMRASPLSGISDLNMIIKIEKLISDLHVFPTKDTYLVRMMALKENVSPYSVSINEGTTDG